MGTEGGPHPRRPSARSPMAHPQCPGSPPAGRSSLRMSRRCCVASSMSMLAQEEAMGPGAGASSTPRSFRYLRAQYSGVQPSRTRQQSLNSVHPSPANRRPRRVPVPHQTHQPPPLPARPSPGSRNLRRVEKKGSGLGAEASPLWDPLVNG